MPKKVIEHLLSRYRMAGRCIKLKHLSLDYKVILIKANPSVEKSIISAVGDPRYHVVTETLGIVE